MSGQLRDYYEVLGIECDATEIEVQKAYKKRALRCHPDKNRNRLEEAAEEFKELNNAYTCLNDKNERAWYDAHKEQILSGCTGPNDEYEPDHMNLYPYFSHNCYKGFDMRDPKCFYHVYQTVFSTILSEEKPYMDRKAKEKFKPLKFGDPHTPIDDVFAFYDVFRGFSTLKTFAWRDKYNPNEAECRQIRRAIDKENDKERKKGKREYNELVRNLASHVRKLDKRVMEHRRKLQLKEAEARAEKSEKDRVAKEAKRKEIAAMSESYWAEMEEQFDFDGEAEILDQVMHQGTDGKKAKASMQEKDYYCPVCKKMFRSKPKWKEHKESKKHKHSMKKKGHLFKDLNLDDSSEEADEEEEEEEEEESESESQSEVEVEQAPKAPAKEAEGGDDEEEEEEETEEGQGGGGGKVPSEAAEASGGGDAKGKEAEEEESSSSSEEAPAQQQAKGGRRGGGSGRQQQQPKGRAQRKGRNLASDLHGDDDDADPADLLDMLHAAGKKGKGKRGGGGNPPGLHAAADDSDDDEPQRGGRRGKPNKKQLARERQAEERKKEAAAKEEAKKQAELQRQKTEEKRRRRQEHEEAQRRNEERKEAARLERLKREQEAAEAAAREGGKKAAASPSDDEEGIAGSDDDSDDSSCAAQPAAPAPQQKKPESRDADEEEEEEEEEESSAPPVAPAAAAEEEVEEGLGVGGAVPTYADYKAHSDMKKKVLKAVKKGDAAMMSIVCGVCAEVFPSRNKLFQHIEATGHAQVKADMTKKKPKRR